MVVVVVVTTKEDKILLYHNLPIKGVRTQPSLSLVVDVRE